MSVSYITRECCVYPEWFIIFWCYFYNCKTGIVCCYLGVIVGFSILANGDMATSSSTGDMIISGNLTISAPVGSEGISGTLKVPTLFAYTTRLLKKGVVVYTFPKGEDVDDYSYDEPYDSTEVDGDREITGEIKVTGFGGHHFIECNTGDMKVARKVLDIEDITGEVEVAVSAFDGEYPEITGEIDITPLVTGENMFISGDIKVPKLFAYTTNLTKDGTTVYTFPEGEDVDDYSYDGEYNGSEVDGNREITGEISTKGMRSATIDCKDGGLIVVLEADLGDNGTINCEKWDVSPSNYFDADMYVLAMLKDGNNLLTCDKSAVDYTQYENANMYVKAMKSVPTYYDKDGNPLPEKHNPDDVDHIDYTPETLITGIITAKLRKEVEITGKIDVYAKINNGGWIDCDKSDVEPIHYKDANMYVIRVMEDEITGDVTIKGVKSADITCDNELIIANEANIDIISGEVKVGHEADGAEITGEITIREAIIKEIESDGFEVEGPAPDTDITGKIDVKVDAPVEEITGTVEVSTDTDVASTSYGFIL